MTLKDAFKNDFPMGVAINQDQFTGQDTNGAALITSQFNAIASENVLKWEIVHPRPGRMVTILSRATPMWRSASSTYVDRRPYARLAQPDAALGFSR